LDIQVLRGTLEIEGSECVSLDVAVKLALASEQREALRNEYKIYHQLRSKGVTAGITNKNFNVTLENNALFAKIVFSSPFDATTFARTWSSSRPAQYKGVIAKYVPEN
jgi:hypothetical protein